MFTHSRLMIEYIVLSIGLLLIPNTLFGGQATGNTLISQNADPVIIKGFDWSLPPNTPVESYSGLIGEGDSKLKTVNNKFVIVRWDQSNPRRGVYDFSAFDTQLLQLSPHKVLVRLEVNSSCEAPGWALQQLRATKDKSLIFWDKDYIRLLKPYIQAFAHRYAAYPQIAGVQLGIADGEYAGSCENFDNKAGWGEFWMSPEVVAETVRNFGFNPDIFESRSKEIIDLYAKAFGDYKYKLAYTNYGPSFSWGEIAIPYNQRMARLAQYALDIGLGNRDGIIEQWMNFIAPIYGSFLTDMPDGTCRLEFSDDYADKIHGRYWGTENEFYGNKGFVLNANGPYENQPYRFLVSSLRALQMRRNFMSISEADMERLDHPVYKTQDFLSYLTKVMGKQMENTPDAFVLLGERYIAGSYAAKNYAKQDCVKNAGDKVAIRSFGRWLVDSGTSKPAIKVYMPEAENFWGQDYYLPEGVDYEYFARQARQFKFDLNDPLSRMRCNHGCPVEAKFTFKDTHKTALTVFVAEGKSQSIKTQGDQKIKTVSFKLHSKFKNKLSGSDILFQSNKGEIPLILFRMNFL